MLYHLLDWLNAHYDIPGFGVFHYITFRAVLAIIFSLVISVLIGKKIINLLRRKLIGESIRDDGPASHKEKKGTPTMGGLIIIAAVIIPTLLWGDLTNAYVILIMVSTLWIGVIGFLDDYIKVFKKNKKGLQGKFKIVGQVGLGLIVGLTMLYHPDFKGKSGKLFSGTEIRPGQVLLDAGFQYGDQLIQLNDQAYSRPPTANGYRHIKSYQVERGSKPGQRKLVTINISEEKRETVASDLFSDADQGFVTKTNLPFLKGYVFNYSLIAFWEESGGIGGKIIYLLIVIFIVTSVSNGVNLTDGIDGLAAGTTAVAAAALGVFCYVSGNVIFSDYLNIFYIPNTAELVIFCAALIGGCVGFLWFNAYPAQIFMGDTGSLALGGAIGVLALMVKKELLIPILCGVFFLETLSVIIQVLWFKYTRWKYGEGRRIFRMAPLHHHYELVGWHEAKITVRFWITAIALAMIAFATLKLR